jgi:hypothetical protein
MRLQAHNESNVIGLTAAIAVVGLAGGHAAGGPTDMYFGHPHTPVGAAQISPDGSGGMVISNIGSSGEDGVLVNLGEVEGFEAELTFGLLGELPEGSSATFALQDVAGQGAGAIAIAETNAGEAAIRVDELAGGQPECVRVSLYNGELLVAEADFSPPYPAEGLVVSNIGSSGCDGVRVAGSRDKKNAGSGTWETHSFFDLSTDGVEPWSLGGGPPVDADRVSMALDGLPPGEPVVRWVAITGNGGTGGGGAGGSILIKTEAAQQFGQAFTALGGAEVGGSFDPNGGAGTFTVSNLGSSGEDGVLFRAACCRQPGTVTILKRTRVTVEPLSLDDPTAGYGFGRGAELNGLPPGEPIVRCIKVPPESVGDGRDLEYDFAGGATSVRVEMYQSGSPAGSEVLPGGSGVAGTILGGPGGLPSIVAVGTTDEGVGLEFDAPCELMLAGGIVLVGDEVRVLVEEGLAETAYSHTEMHGQGGGSIIITGVEETLDVEPVLFLGFDHAPVDGAEVAIDPGTGHLTVSNIGSSGCDGVSIDLGDANGWGGELDLAPTGVLPTGGIYTVAVADPLNNAPTKGLELREAGGGSTLQLVTGASPPGSVEVAYGAPGFNSAFVTVQNPTAGPVADLLASEAAVYSQVGVHVEDSDAHGGRLLTLTLPSPIMMDVAGHGLVSAHTVRVRDAFSLSVFVFEPKEISAVASVTNPGPGEDQFTLRDEFVVVWEQAKLAGEGEARLRVENCEHTSQELTVSNIDSSGEDGFSIDLADNKDNNCNGPPDSCREVYEMGLGPAGALPPSSSAQLQWLDTDSDADCVMSLGLRETGGGLGEVTLDTFALDPTSTVVEALLDGAVVDTVAHLGPHPAAVAVGNIGSSGEDGVLFSGRCMDDDTGVCEPTLELSWPVPGDVLLTGRPDSVVADGVRIRPQGGLPVPVAARRTFVFAHMLEVSGRVDVVSDAPPCASDISGPDGMPDGNVDALDFLVLIGQWGSPCGGSCSADITGPAGTPDGNVDALDYLRLISEWGTPGNCPSS